MAHRLGASWRRAYCKRAAALQTMTIVGFALATAGCHAAFVSYHPTGSVALRSAHSSSELRLLLADKDRSFGRNYGILLAKEIVGQVESVRLLLAPKKPAEGEKVWLSGLDLSEAVPLELGQARGLIDFLDSIMSKWDAKRNSEEAAFEELAIGPEPTAVSERAHQPAEPPEIWLRVAWSQTAEGSATVVVGRRGPKGFVLEFRQVAELRDLQGALKLGVAALSSPAAPAK